MLRVMSAWVSTVQWFAKRISDKTRELYNKKYYLAGEFAKVVSGKELAEMYPEKGSEILELEETLVGLKGDLNRELNRILAVEADNDHEQLMITMNGGELFGQSGVRSSSTHRGNIVSTSRVNEKRRC